MYDNILIDENRVILLGKKNRVYTFESEYVLNKYMTSLFDNVVFGHIELIKKVPHEDGKFSYLKVDSYKNENAKSYVRLVVYKNYISYIKELLRNYNYTKVKNKQKKLKKLENGK